MSKSFYSKLAGVTHSNENGKRRQTIIKRCVEDEDVLLLEREPNNPYDKNAIAAFVVPNDDPWDEGEYQVGFLNSEVASELAPLMDCGHRVTCVVSEVTGGDAEKTTLGVNVLLTIYTPEEVADYERKKQIAQEQHSKPEKKVGFFERLFGKG